MTQDAAAPISASLLEATGVRHGFFTRAGGVSAGLYASLNGGVGSKDDPRSVAENRRRMAAHLQVDAECLLVPYQVHSPDALIVSAPFAERPRCDALVTSTPGVGLGVTGADCGMILFSDPKAGVIGAAHAGWKGALTGVIEATLEAMEQLGAERASIVVALGPAIGPESYEVGPEFIERFCAQARDYERFFAASSRAGHFMFDLPGFIGGRLQAAGIERFQNLALDTYADPERFYSYRRSVHRQEADYGRLVSAIALV
ncbi:peptidoglycan editing factor PgeF [Methylocapsa aurea]|uniref:peptidoglycan editing factor PgeF n=1 Tax=Methylocapsa aurea TaxID=663610 RepID=UPI00068D7E49|nr:peptidoglycan editing factor PgeF [Methylocapsa aurea]